MEASPPATPPPERRAARENGGYRARSGFIALAIFAGLVAIFFAAVAIDLSGTPTCEEVLDDQGFTGGIVECTERSSSNKVAAVILGAATSLAALALLVMAIGSARVREPASYLRPLLVLVVLGALLTIVL